jgi:2-dehydropantoate 2-reductase
LWWLDGIALRSAIVGSGGVGGYFGGRLAQAGVDVTFVARGAHLEAMRRHGLRVESIDGDFVVTPVDAVAIADAVPVDAVLLAVKAWQIDDAAHALAPLLGPDTFVLPLQNGVDACDRVAAVIGSERVIGGVCRIVSFLAAPGVIRHIAAAPRIDLGERDGSRSQRVVQLVDELARAEGMAVVLSDKIDAAMWEKFVFIVPVSGVGAVTRVPLGVLRNVAESRAMLEAAMHEVAAVARARGVELAADVVPRTMTFVDALAGESTSSMQRDIADGRPSEFEDQVGAVVRIAAEVGVPVPVHAFLYASLRPLELRARGHDPGGI